MRVQVINKPLPYGGKSYQVGEPLDMPDRYARVFVALGRVKEAKSEEIEKPKRAYKRRDLRAE